MTKVNSSFWIYVEGSRATNLLDLEYIDNDKLDEIWEHDSAELACQRIWHDLTTYRGVGGQTTVNNTHLVAGYISPILKEFEEEIERSYKWGRSRSRLSESSDLSQAANIDMPILLSWQPEIGWEEARLWRKGYTWALAMGLLWLPIIGCFFCCFFCCACRSMASWNDMSGLKRGNFFSRTFF